MLARRSIQLIASCLLLLALAGCNTVPSQVGSMIAKRLPTLLGPADRYDVHADGSIINLLRGKLSSVHIHGDNVALSPVLHVHSFDADATDIHANPRTDAIEGIGHTSFHIAMNQADMDNFMIASKPDNWKQGARIILNPTYITYTDSVGIMRLRTPFSVSGRLAPRSGHPDQMDFTPFRGSVSRLNIPLKMVQFAVNRQNPVVDLSQMNYPVSITGAKVDHGILLVDGTVDLRSLLGSNPTAPTSPTHG